MNSPRRLAAIVLCCVCLAANDQRASESEDELATKTNAGSQSLTSSDAQSGADRELLDLETRLQMVSARAAKTVVRVFKNKENCSFSGVIVSGDGEIVTCAHHGVQPDEKVRVSLSGGREAQATMLGVNRVFDLGMMRLDDPWPWPFSKVGTVVGLKSGSRCFVLGYPGLNALDDQSPLFRLASVDYPGTGAWLVSTAKLFGGDSGGGIFDLQGRLIGINFGMPTMSLPTADHFGIDVFVRYRKKLLEGKVILEQADRVMSAPDRELQTKLRASVVEILCDGRPAALGTVVHADGWIMTKRTELSGKVECKLSEGKILAARRIGESFRHDLALLELDASKLQTPEWAEKDSVQLTRLVAVPGVDRPLLELGVIGQTEAKNPGTKGWLLISVRPLDSDRDGVRISELAEGPDLEGKVLVDDIITHFNGTTTPTVSEFVRIRDEFCSGAKALAGERIDLTITRGNEIVHAYPSLQPEANIVRYSLRCDGFPDVFTHDATISPAQCGGPVFDVTGRMLGINIARADFVRTFAIPSHTVQQIFEQLKAAD